jgi:hypothetical protein
LNCTLLELRSSDDLAQEPILQLLVLRSECLFHELCYGMLDSFGYDCAAQ